MNFFRRCHRVIFSQRWRSKLRAWRPTARCVPAAVRVCVFFCSKKKTFPTNLAGDFGIFPSVWSTIWTHETWRGLNDIALYGSRCASPVEFNIKKPAKRYGDGDLMIKTSRNFCWNSIKLSGDFSADFWVKFGKVSTLQTPAVRGYSAYQKPTLLTYWDPLTS